MSWRSAVKAASPPFT